MSRAKTCDHAPEDQEMQTCLSCGETKRICAFPNDSRMKSGVTRRCRQCVIATYGDRYRKKPRTRAGALYQAAKSRSMKEGLPFNLTIDWIERKIAAGVCEVTGVRFDLDREVGTSQRNPLAPSLDQRVPSAGYTTDNVQVVLWAYNALKGTSTDAEAARVIKEMAASLPPL